MAHTIETQADYVRDQSDQPDNKNKFAMQKKSFISDFASKCDHFYM